MKRFRYSILVSMFSFASSFSMNPVVDLTDPSLLNHPRQEYATKKSGIILLLKRWKYKVIHLDNCLSILKDHYDNRYISKDQYLNKKQVIMNEIRARQDLMQNRLGQVIGHPIFFDRLIRIDRVKNKDLGTFAEQLLE